MLLHERITEDNWTQHAHARARNGKIVRLKHHNAVSWCLLGHVDDQISSWIQRIKTYHALSKTIKILYPERVSPIPLFGGMLNWPFLPAPMVIISFNDHDLTTFEDTQRVCKVSGH